MPGEEARRERRRAPDAMHSLAERRRDPREETNQSMDESLRAQERLR
jgi:hypothetical protein